MNHQSVFDILTLGGGEVGGENSHFWGGEDSILESEIPVLRSMLVSNGVGSATNYHGKLVALGCLGFEPGTRFIRIPFIRGSCFKKVQTTAPQTIG